MLALMCLSCYSILVVVVVVVVVVVFQYFNSDTWVLGIYTVYWPILSTDQMGHEKSHDIGQYWPDIQSSISVSAAQKHTSSTNRLLWYSKIREIDMS